MLPMSRTEATISQAVRLMLLTIVSEALFLFCIQMCADYYNASNTLILYNIITLIFCNSSDT